MYFVTTANAYDVLGNVHAHVIVKALSDDTAATWSTVFECTTTVPGIGEPDPREWLRDALVSLLEAI